MAPAKLMSTVRRLVAAPSFEDPGKNATAHLLNAVAWAVILLATVVQPISAAFTPRYSLRYFALSALLDAACIGLLALNRRGHVRAAAWFLTLTTWAILTVYAWTAGGLMAPSIAGQLAVVVLGGMLLGAREGVAMGLVSAATIFGLAFAQRAGMLPVPFVQHTEFSRASVLVSYIMTLALLQTVIMTALKRARDRAVEAEAKIRALNAELEARVAQRTVELEGTVKTLEATNRQLDEATRAKSEFLASMSHELRTPLNSIIGFSGILTSGMAGDMSDEQRRQSKMIANSGKRLLELVNQVLDLSRIEAGEERLRATAFDAAELAAEVVGALAPQWQEKGLEVSVDAPAAVPMHSDPARLERILTNLVANAVRFTPVGSVIVSVREHDGTVSFAVADTGAGIPEPELPRIFEDFYQVAPAQGGKHAGTGLGLSIASRLASMLGGSISVTSVVGVGTTFTLTLPSRLGAVPAGE